MKHGLRMRADLLGAVLSLSLCTKKIIKMVTRPQMKRHLTVCGATHLCPSQRLNQAPAASATPRLSALQGNVMTALSRSH